VPFLFTIRQNKSYFAITTPRTVAFPLIVTTDLLLSGPTKVTAIATPP
jgi:hypothetical protein